MSKVKEEDLSVPIPESLSEALNNEKLRDLFRFYLKNHIASECLLFYENIEMYERIESKEFRKRAAKGLLVKFIFDQAQYRINISSKTKNALLNKRPEDFKRNSFGQAKLEMYRLMEDNYFLKFVNYLKGEETLTIINRNTLDLYKKAKRIYSMKRRRPRFKGDSQKSERRSSNSPASTQHPKSSEAGMPPPKPFRDGSRLSDGSFASVEIDHEEIERMLKELDSDMKGEFDYGLL